MTYINALATLADPTRQKIVAALANGSLTVGELASRLPVSRPAVSQHLKVLRESGLVTEARAGTRHYFSVDPAGAGELRDYFEDLWQQAMRAFAQHVAREETRRGDARS